MNYAGIFTYFAGLILLYLILFPGSKLFLVPPVLFSFQALDEDLHFVPVLSASILIISGYLKKEKGLTTLKVLFALLPVIPFLFNSHEGYVPILPFPALLKTHSAPFPVFLFIIIVLLKGSLPLKLFSLSIFLTFLFPSFKILFNALLFVLTMGGISLLEEEIVRGEGEFFSTLMRGIWAGIKVIFFVILFLLIFFPGEKLTRDILYIFLSLIFFETGFLLKSATILIRHKVYFAATGPFLSTIFYCAF